MRVTGILFYICQFPNRFVPLYRNVQVNALLIPHVKIPPPKKKQLVYLNLELNEEKRVISHVELIQSLDIREHITRVLHIHTVFQLS